MKTLPRRRPAWAVCLLALVCVGAVAALPDAGPGPLRRALSAAAPPVETEARVIVKYKADSALMRALSVSAAAAGPQQAAAMSTRLGLSLSDGRAVGDRVQVLKATGIGSAALAAQLGAQPDVEYAVVDGRQRALVAPNDPLYLNNPATQTPAAGQWYLQAPDATYVSAINAPAAWAVTTGSAAVVVADLDTGIRADHPDLVNKLVAGRNFVSTDGTSQSGWGVDPSDPGDYTTTTNQCKDGIGPQASSWHGTQTAGLIGAQTDNGIGMASIGREVRVQALRVLGTCGGYDSDIQAAMRWAAGIDVPGLPANPTPARVVNMSLGSTGACSAAYQDVVNQLVSPPAGSGRRPVVVVVAAGNSGLAVGTPANCTGVIAVAGVRNAGDKVGYSDLGPNVTISAPAGNCTNGTGGCLYPILTTSNSGATAPVAGAAGAIYTDGLNNASYGTSFSAPLVSGSVALMLSANAALTPAQVTSALQRTARPFPSTGGTAAAVGACTAPTTVAQTYCYCTTSTCGAGLTDAGAATLAAATIHAQITPSATSVVAGGEVMLDGSGSWPGGGAASITTYQWAITGGATLASLTSSTSATASLLTQAAGTVTVALTVTDAAGRQATSSVALTVTPAAPPAPPPSGGGGGGGAIGLVWLAGLLAAVIGVAAVAPRRAVRRDN